jgi:hypothetical protein
VKCLEEELFRQGDKEKAAGLSVSPLMDRSKAGVTKSQVGFFDIVAMPLFQAYVQVCGWGALLSFSRKLYTVLASSNDCVHQQG